MNNVLIQHIKKSRIGINLSKNWNEIDKLTYYEYFMELLDWSRIKVEKTNEIWEKNDIKWCDFKV